MTEHPGVLPHYDDLAGQEARFWGNVGPRSDNPQLWDDPFLFDVFLKPEWDYLIRTVADAGGNVLEVGCGEGRLAIELAKRGCRVRAVDISPERIGRAKEYANADFREDPSHAPVFEVADLNTAHFSPEEYTTVVAHDALHHILRLDDLLAGLSKSLKSGGNIVVYDYVGMGKIRKILAAALYALLPTYQPYSQKLKLAGRFGNFMSGEKGKRDRLRTAPATADHGSPFEEISQESIVPLLEKHFRVEERRESHPFFFYLAPKLRCPRSIRPAFWRFLKSLDDAMLASGLSRGAYIFIKANKRA